MPIRRVEIEVVEAEPLDGGRHLSLEVPAVPDRLEVVGGALTGGHPVEGPQPVLDAEHVGDGAVGLQDQVLGQVRDPLRPGHRTRGGREHTGQDLQQGGLAGAVATHQAGDPVGEAGVEVGEDGLAVRPVETEMVTDEGRHGLLQESGMTGEQRVRNGTRHCSAGSATHRDTGVYLSTGTRIRLVGSPVWVQPVSEDTRDRQPCTSEHPYGLRMDPPGGPQGHPGVSTPMRGRPHGRPVSRPEGGRQSAGARRAVARGRARRASAIASTLAAVVLAGCGTPAPTTPPDGNGSGTPTQAAVERPGARSRAARPPPPLRGVR